ncbi:uncharacterized protein B0I36DRAFT_321141 [Microdochium trichocladiopsis]|uniref:Uncharacterized protein n=1 Tax=Microdochium trichocladiopsis TaxID=1682393 RepID=A0A9P8Y8T7_9PEZI|nr:uncharacterized protein B0I36DRAFT_321141 [Microdochium trichocladiopsis]KAH7033289.1 hypothetical protein B0I36DRAFT_321141 [Microdochium trichocladiopsis]
MTPTQHSLSRKAVVYVVPGEWPTYFTPRKGSFIKTKRKRRRIHPRSLATRPFQTEIQTTHQNPCLQDHLSFMSWSALLSNHPQIYSVGSHSYPWNERRQSRDLNVRCRGQESPAGSTRYRGGTDPLRCWCPHICYFSRRGWTADRRRLAGCAWNCGRLCCQRNAGIKVYRRSENP